MSPRLVCKCACHPREMLAPSCQGCRCPACGLEALYAPAPREHACQDPKCVNAPGYDPDAWIYDALGLPATQPETPRG